MTSSRLSEQASDPDDIFSELSDEELYWRDRQEFLESRGFMLRPRYKRDWEPSWKGKPSWAVCKAEDSYALPFRTSVINATRICDETLVYIKRVARDS